MPELPEVTTTVNGLNEVLPHKTVTDVWSDYYISSASKRLDTIKNKKFFEYFKKELIGEKVKSAERKGKNVLIHFSNNKTVLIHMKMTGHLLYGKYSKLKVESEKLSSKYEGKWVAIEPEGLKDPFSRFIHLVFTLSNGKHLAFSDMRKFAKVTLFKTNEMNLVDDITKLGPDPIGNLSLSDFVKQISKKPNGKIKTVLMEQDIVSGIGNIYSDEILWESGVHPERLVKNISTKELNMMWKSMKNILIKSIDMGGDSMSDYRNIHGQKGSFQNAHKVYKRKNEKCSKRNCAGMIKRKVVAGRSAHFCDTCQIM